MAILPVAAKRHRFRGATRISRSRADRRELDFLFSRRETITA